MDVYVKFVHIFYLHNQLFRRKILSINALYVLEMYSIQLSGAPFETVRLFIAMLAILIYIFDRRRLEEWRKRGL